MNWLTKLFTPKGPESQAPSRLRAPASGNTALVLSALLSKASGCSNIKLVAQEAAPGDDTFLPGRVFVLDTGECTSMGGTQENMVNEALRRAALVKSAFGINANTPCELSSDPRGGFKLTLTREAFMALQLSPLYTKALGEIEAGRDAGRRY